MKKNIILTFLLFVIMALGSPLSSQDVQRPKLVVGIVVDQMRFDYLYRFLPFYGMNGFRRLMNEGSNFTFAHYNYEATKTAPGHASIYTGTTPYFHGIIANDWYDKQSKTTVNSVIDHDYKSLGSNDSEGEASPKKLLATTITDQIKLASNKKSKVISISYKDRAAVLPGGHMPDGVYWYNQKTGNYVTSTYYMNSLPQWVTEFNNKKLSDQYLSSVWQLSLPEEKYLISTPDESNSEEDVFNEGRTSFPHSFKNVKSEDKYSLLGVSPFGNDLIAGLAKQALISENLGKGEWADFLAISFSSTDIVAHAYGTNSYETQDTYIKLDATIADFLNTLDKTIGKGNYLLFLTADHAGLDTPLLLKENNLPTGGLMNESFAGSVKAFVTQTFGNDKSIENISNKQIYFDRNEIEKSGLDIHTLQQKTTDFIRDSFPVISSLFTRDKLEGLNAAREPINPTLNSYNPALSGDIVYTLQPGYLPNFMEKGTTHGSQYSYDTHVPILFYGWNIPAQTINTPVFIVDIAATIADLLKITEPSACMGIPIIRNEK